MLKLAGVTLSVLLLSAVGILPYHADAQTTKFLLYKNKQYGFSIEYPSTWQKVEPQKDPTSKSANIVSFAPSQNTAYSVSFSANDKSIKGLNGEQILAALKKQVTDTCSAASKQGLTCSDITANHDTHKNGYAIYAVYYTASGTSFMSTFNSFYYSFSPTVADLERQNSMFKEAIKLTITPLLSSLSLLQYVDIDSDAEMLGYGISIILLNIGMYFVAPAILIIKLKKRLASSH